MFFERIGDILSTFYELRIWWNPLNNLSWRCVCMCARVNSMETTKELHLIGLNYWIEGYYFWRFLEVFFGILRKTYWYILQLTWIWIIWLLDSMAFAKDANLDLPERKAPKMGKVKHVNTNGAWWSWKWIVEMIFFQSRFVFFIVFFWRLSCNLKKCLFGVHL